MVNPVQGLKNYFKSDRWIVKNSQFILKHLRFLLIAEDVLFHIEKFKNSNADAADLADKTDLI